MGNLSGRLIRAAAEADGPAFHVLPCQPQRPAGQAPWPQLTLMLLDLGGKVEDEQRRARIRSLVTAGSVAFVIAGGNAVVFAWGRPARTVAITAALTVLVVLVYLHLIRFSSSRPIRWGSFQGLSWADCYRVADTMARGEAVAEPHLARPAMGYARQLETASRLGLLLVPLVLGSMVLRRLTDDLSGRGLAFDLLALAIVVAGTIRSRLRIPRFREAEARTRALHHLE